MRDKVAKYLKDYCTLVIVYVSMLFILITDSLIALIVFSVLVHLTTLFLIVGLYVDDVVHINKVTLGYKYALIRIINIFAILTVLTIQAHYYTLFITCFCMFLGFVYIYDLKSKIHPDKIE